MMSGEQKKPGQTITFARLADKRPLTAGKRGRPLHPPLPRSRSCALSGGEEAIYGLSSSLGVNRREGERFYFDLLDYGCTPQEARSVLPNSLKTEVVMTANMREWRHFIKLRTSPAAHPDMRVVAEMVYHTLLAAYPVFFEDIEVE